MLILSIISNRDTKSESNSGQSLAPNDKYTRLEESRSVTPSPPLNSHLFDSTKRQTHIPVLSPITSTDSSPTTTDANNPQEGTSKLGLRPKLLGLTAWNHYLGKSSYDLPPKIY